MKKILALLLTLVMTVGAVGCGGNEKVTYTIPEQYSEFITSGDFGSIEDELFTKNEDGSISMELTSKEKDEVIEGLHMGLEAVAEEIRAGELISSILDIKYNDDLTEFDIYVNVDEQMGLEVLVAFSLANVGALKQVVFENVAEDSIDITIRAIDSKTEEVLSESSFLEMAESFGE